MKTLLLRKPGRENLTLTDRPIPEPGPGQVLVRIRAISLNYRDLLTLDGGYGSAQKQSDLIPFSDGAGEVAAIGEGVSAFRPGDRVIGNFFQTWISGPPTMAHFASALGGPIDGVGAEYCLFSEDGLVRTPAHLSDEEAAALPCAGLTAWSAVVEQGNLRPGNSILIQGTGGVSIFAFQFAKLLGARVCATSSSDEKLQRLKAMGANGLINYRETPKWGRAAVKANGGRSFDHIVEVGGRDTLNESLKAIRPGGSLSLIGVLSGTDVDLRLPFVVMANIRLQGITVGSRLHFENMLRAMEDNDLHPVIDRVFDLGELDKALDHMASGRHFGKICVRMN